MKRLLMVVALLLLAVPAQAQNVTLKLEKASLHEVLVKLAQQTHQTFESLDGAGQEGYKDPPNALRVPIDWKDTPLVVAVRQICRLFALSVHKDGASYYHFVQGDEAPAEQIRDGYAFFVEQTERSASTTFTPGSARANRWDLATLHVMIRSETNHPQEIGPITRVSVTDEAGKTLRSAAVTYPTALTLADEHEYRVLAQGLSPGTRRLRVSGEVGIMKPEEQRQLVIPLPKEGELVHLPIDHQFGPVRVRIMRLHVANDGVDVVLRYGAPGAVIVGYLKGLGSLQMQGPTGRSWPMGFQLRVGVENDGQEYTEVEGYRNFDGRPASLTLTVPVREGFVRTIPFQFDQVVLPPVLDEPLQVRNVGESPEKIIPEQGPRAYLDPKGGSVRLPALGLSDQHGMRLALGFARREASGEWSPTRWVERDAYWDPVRVRFLAPGTYRVQVRGSVISVGGSGVLRPLGTATVTVLAGKEASVSLTPAAPAGHASSAPRSN